MKHTPGPVETLARYCIQISSDHYQENPDFRDAVDAVLGQPIYDAAPDLLDLAATTLAEWHDDGSNFDKKEPPRIEAIRRSSVYETIRQAAIALTKEKP